VPTHGERLAQGAVTRRSSWRRSRALPGPHQAAHAQDRETLALIAHEEYDDRPNARIADANGIVDPRDVSPGPCDAVRPSSSRGERVRQLYQADRKAHETASTATQAVRRGDRHRHQRQGPGKARAGEGLLSRLPGSRSRTGAGSRSPRPARGRFLLAPALKHEVLIAFERGERTGRTYRLAWNGKDKPMQAAYADENTTRLMIQTRFRSSGHSRRQEGQREDRHRRKSGKRTAHFDVKNRKFLIEARRRRRDPRGEEDRAPLQDLEVKTKRRARSTSPTTSLNVKDRQRQGWSQLNLKASRSTSLGPGHRRWLRATLETQTTAATEGGSGLRLRLGHQRWLRATPARDHSPVRF